MTSALFLEVTNQPYLAPWGWCAVQVRPVAKGWRCPRCGEKGAFEHVLREDTVRCTECARERSRSWWIPIVGPDAELECSTQPSMFVPSDEKRIA